ncbi:hypothetical protein MANES_14G136829v8 [Manihot esculenta]|uniref:Uncharacterized protein n=1 Tax=Manihot esculenta TaxID=3983 RepID=A0ACB7GI92_MANES|nr:hypothetical protein MANES_14G136829v8 [Manihot esculenta]
MLHSSIRLSPSSSSPQSPHQAVFFLTFSEFCSYEVKLG